METRISATELARRLGDVLARVRYRHDVFVVERNGEAVARLAPVPSRTSTTLAEAIRAWHEAAPTDPGFADDLARVNAADRPPRNPWGS